MLSFRTFLVISTASWMFALHLVQNHVRALSLSLMTSTIFSLPHLGHLLGVSLIQMPP